MTVTNVEIEGTDRLVENLNRISNNIRGRVAKEAVHSGGLQIQNNARLNIRKTFSSRQTGKLANSISTTSRITGNGAEAQVEVDRVYGRIQEYGGTIVPIRGKFLVWRDPDSGEIIRARKVRLPARPYFGPAITEHHSDILDAMSKVIDRYLATEHE